MLGDLAQADRRAQLQVCASASMARNSCTRFMSIRTRRRDDAAPDVDHEIGAAAQQLGRRDGPRAPR